MWPSLQRTLAPWLLAVGLSCSSAAHAQSDASLGLSMLPLASVVVTGAGASAASGAAIALPAALSIGGASLTVKAVQVSAEGTVLLLERASDGAEASVVLSAEAASAVAHGVGTVVLCSVIGTGVILSAAGEVLAFIPNALGHALLHNERL